jgi:NitT/TauT family transport system permease protein
MNKLRNLSEESSPKRTSSIFANKKILWKIGSVLLALLLWHFLAVFLNQKLLLVTPLRALSRLGELVREEGFFPIVLFSLLRIVLGFLSGLFVGVILAVLSGRFKAVEYLLWPYMLTIKSVPVASFVVLALLWVSTGNLSWLISFLMVLPIVYTNLLTGIKSLNNEMRELAVVFKIPRLRQIRYIFLPELKPYILSACRVSIGLAWKAGIAAELIGYPRGSVGEALYYSKIFLNTADIFAWTLVVVLLSLTCEKLFLAMLKKIFERLGR